MQLINTGIRLGDSTKLTEFVALLNEVAVPKYFSRVELEDNVTDSGYNCGLVKCYVDDQLFMEFREYKTPVVGKVRIVLPNTEFVASASNVVGFGHGVLLTDNAIVFFPSSMYSDEITFITPIVVCKTTDDKTMCIYTTNGTSIISLSNSYGASGYLVQHVAGVPSSWDNSYNWYQGARTNNDGVTTAAAMPTVTGYAAKDVYQAVYRSPYNINYPFLFTQNGESYCGVAYNNYIIKTT